MNDFKFSLRALAQRPMYAFITNSYPKNDLEFAGSSIPGYLDRKEQAPALEWMALLNSFQRTLGTGERPENVMLVRQRRPCSRCLASADTAAIASLILARRAAGIAPMAALRGE